MLRDLGSLNGTFVGETRLASEPVALETGERFSLGPVTLQIEYHAEDDAAGGASEERSSAARWQRGGATVDSPLEDVQEVDAPRSASRRS